MDKLLSFKEYKELNTIYSIGFQITFKKKYYEKYDRFKFGNLYFICMSNPKRNKKGWSYEIFPIDSELEYNKDNIYPTYYVSQYCSNDMKKNYELYKGFFKIFNKEYGNK